MAQSVRLHKEVPGGRKRSKHSSQHAQKYISILLLCFAALTYCNIAPLKPVVQARSPPTPPRPSHTTSVLSPSLPACLGTALLWNPSHSPLQPISNTLPTAPCSLMQLSASGISLFPLCPSSAHPCCFLSAGQGERLCSHTV